jgi:hypothetical protein
MNRRIQEFTYSRYWRVAPNGDIEPVNRPPDSLTVIAETSDDGRYATHTPVAWVQYAMLYYVNP